ncbi:hypothetical protein FB446DRAFT_621015, partial [Lentinula raphanica]
ILYWRTFPLHDLPTEILSEILRFVIWSAPSRRIGFRSQLQLTWVSKSLRDAVISDAILWSTIPFCDAPPFTRSLTFVERSGTSVLDFRIEPVRKITDGQLCALLEALTPNLHRVRALVVRFEKSELLVVLNWLRDRAQISKIPFKIERLDIHQIGNPQSFDPVNHTVSLYPLLGGRNDSRLRSLTVNGVDIDWVNPPLFDKLTTLHLRRLPLSPSHPLFYRILARSTNLTTLSLDAISSVGDPTANDHPIVEFGQLYTLSLANLTAPHAKNVISYFAAPSLKHLSIVDFKGADYGPFFEFMIGRFQEVELLTLRRIDYLDDAFLSSMTKWLDSMPLLACARLAAIRHHILQAFNFDPDTMQLH